MDDSTSIWVSLIQISGSAQLLLSDAKRFLTLAGSADKYVSLLRQIAAQYGSLPNPVRKKMQITPFLLGFERVKANGQEGKTMSNADLDDEEDDGLLTYRLGSASEVRHRLLRFKRASLILGNSS